MLSRDQLEENFGELKWGQCIVRFAAGRECLDGGRHLVGVGNNEKGS